MTRHSPFAIRPSLSKDGVNCTISVGLAAVSPPVLGDDHPYFYKKGAQIMAKQQEGIGWIQNKADIIMLANRSGHNFILDLPTGRYRLDAGRRMRTMRSILAIPQVKQLVDQGELVVE